MTTLKRNLSGAEAFAVQTVASLSWLCFLGLPYDLISLRERLSISEAVAGWITSWELMALALAAIVSVPFVAAADKRKMCITGLLIATVGMLFAALSSNLIAVIVGRTLFGIGLGIVTAAVTAIPALYLNPGRIYARIICMVAVLATVLMYSLPPVMASVGSVGLEYTELAILLVFGVSAAWVPVARNAVASCGNVIAKAGRHALLKPGVPSAIVAIGALLGSQAVGWAFAGAAAESLNASVEQTSLAFTACAFMQIPATLLAVYIGNRSGYKPPVLAASICLVLISLGMYSTNSIQIFMISTALLGAFGAFALPYQQALLAELDDSGEGAAAGGASLNIGTAIGPAIGSASFSIGGLESIAVASIILILLSLILTYVGANRLNRAQSSKLASI